MLNSKSVCSGYIFAVDPDKTRKITINALKHFQGCAIIFSVTMELLYSAWIVTGADFNVTPTKYS